MATPRIAVTWCWNWARSATRSATASHPSPPSRTPSLAEKDKIKLYVGSLDDLADLPKVLAYYKADFAADVRFILFVVNIDKPLVIDLEGLSISAIGMQEGLIWNELIDLAALDKGDFKGQSASEKIVTVYKALGDYKPKGDQVSFDEALNARWTKRGTRSGLNLFISAQAGIQQERKPAKRTRPECCLAPRGLFQ
jgi:hypothetical protein